MTEPNEQQIEIIVKHKLNPDNWLVLIETSKKLVIKNRRWMRRELKKEGVK